MHKLIITTALILFATNAWCDFTCTDGSNPVCLDKGDKVCPATARCVDTSAVCFDEFPCDVSEGFVCESRYDAMMKDYKETAQEHDTLAKQNVELREQRQQWKNCVLNASTLLEARKCVH